MSKKQLIDSETGEIVYAVVPIRQKHIGGGFFMGIQEGFLHLAKSNLTLEETRIIMLLFSKLDFENWLRISQSDIAKELDMQRSNISRAIKRLVEKGILHKGPKVGTSWTYRLDPSFGWKGKASKKKQTQDALRKAKELGLTVLDND